MTHPAQIPNRATPTEETRMNSTADTFAKADTMNLTPKEAKNVAYLRITAHHWEGLTQCQEWVQHPRNGRRPCLTVLNPSDPHAMCPVAHRHVTV